MKNLIVALAIVTGFAACSNPKTGDLSAAKTKDSTAVDTAGLAQFQHWKQQQEMLQANGVYNGVNEFEDANKTAVVPVKHSAAKVPARTRSTSHTSNTSNTSSSTNNGNSNGGGSVAQAPAPARKKGWSKAAKGTVIGAGSGAVIGAIVSKKKGLGAVIGGVVGAGVGYGVGRSQDKKDGRY